MGRGTHRGFITHEELNKSLGKRNLSNQNLEQAFLHILDDKISLVEKKSDFKVLRKKDSSSKDEEKTVEKLKVRFKKEIGEQRFKLINNNFISSQPSVGFE